MRMYSPNKLEDHHLICKNSKTEIETLYNMRKTLHKRLIGKIIMTSSFPLSYIFLDPHWFELPFLVSLVGGVLLSFDRHLTRYIKRKLISRMVEKNMVYVDIQK